MNLYSDIPITRTSFDTFLWIIKIMPEPKI